MTPVGETTVAAFRYQYDDLCVCTLCLGGILRDWVERWDKEHPPENTYANNRYVAKRAGNGFRKDKLALAFLADEVGISVRQLRRILTAEWATTSLALADEILCAIDQTYLMPQLTVYRRNRQRIPGFYGHSHVCDLGVLKEAA